MNGSPTILQYLGDWQRDSGWSGLWLTKNPMVSPSKKGMAGPWKSLNLLLEPAAYLG